MHNTGSIICYLLRVLHRLSVATRKCRLHSVINHINERKSPGRDSKLLVQMEAIQHRPALRFEGPMSDIFVVYIHDEILISA
jgi:hypothetical protein